MDAGHRAGPRSRGQTVEKMRLEGLLSAMAVMAATVAAVSCGPGMGMMSRGRMSGGEMMRMMRRPGAMQEWLDEMQRDPEMMGRMMRLMHERMPRAMDGEGGPLYWPMMGFTPDDPPAPEPSYEPGSLGDQELFTLKCSRCHALPDPSQHTAEEWGQTLDRMAGYIDKVQFTSLSDEERAAIQRYLESAAAR